MTAKPKAQSRRQSDPKPVRVISVTSGKGGVGKTNITTNLALALVQAGKKVLIWDADLGLANIDVLLGLRPEFNIHHLLTGEKTLPEILIEGPGGVRIMPGSSGIQELSHLGEGQRNRLLSEFDDYDDDLDFLLIDTAAGISSNVMYFNKAARERFIVVTPEPTSITDAYAVIKVLVTRYNQKRFIILPNQVSNEAEAKNLYRILAKVADDNLGPVALDYLGFIPADQFVVKSVRQQRAVLDAYPNSEAGKSFTALARKIISIKPKESLDGDIQFFWKRLLKI